jgi:probable HAF family extracellular repeat protein
VVDLGTLGGSFSSPLDLNGRGEVIGVSVPAGDAALRGFIWRRGVMSDIGSLGGPQSAAAAINSSGQVAGWSNLDREASPSIFNETSLFCNPPMVENEPAVVCHAVLANRGRLVDLGTLGGPNSAAENRAINDRGQVAGVAETPRSDPTGRSGARRFHATLWTAGKGEADRRMAIDLGTVGKDPDSVATGLNNRGQVIGISVADGSTYTGDNGRGFLWEEGQKTLLPPLGGSYSVPTAINNRGHVVGASFLSGDKIAHATLWTGHRTIDLGALPGDVFSEATDITDRGLIVGYSCSATQCRAVRWTRNHVITDLNPLTRPAGQWQLGNAQAANEHGQIVGDGQHADQSHGFLATPRRKG